MRYVFIVAVLAVIPLTAQKLPDGPGKDLFANVCSTCHGLEIATSQKKSRALWQATVDSMVAMGAEANKKQVEEIVNYLAKNFGTGEAATSPDPVATATAAANAMPEGPGKQIILRECTACHLPDHFTKYRHTNEEWQAIVIRMGTRVRSATKEELDTVQKYLATNFPKKDEAGKLNVNKANATDIATNLGLTPEEAKAVIEYRQQHGTFREWGELLAIYGVDGRKIEAAKDRMSF
jgi:competence ComEA-like helix-hairpin-helix protein